MSCPVVKAIKEIRGGWDAWDNEDRGLIKINGVEYVCTATVFYLTIRKMEYARGVLRGTLDREKFFAGLLAGTQLEYFHVIEAAILQDIRGKFDVAINAAWRVMSQISRAVVTAAYKKKSPPLMPAFDPAPSADFIAVVNQCVEYVNLSGQVDVMPLPPASENTTGDKKADGGHEQLMAAEEEILRGVGRREVEYVAAINKLTEVIAASKKITAWLYS